MIFFKSGVRRTGDASSEAFKAEALPHMASLYNAALYMTRDPEEAEDLVQDTFLKAHRFWGRYQEGTNCKAWLFRILTNTFINRNRRKKRIFTPMDDAATEHAAAEAVSGVGSFYVTPETAYLNGLFPEHIQDAIEELPENFRIPVILADLQDFSYKEIADIMDCPVGTVMSRLFRGRKRLQEALFEYAVEQGIIAKSDARDDDGAISLEAYRARKSASGSS